MNEDQANLGLATTRELLSELKARFEVDRISKLGANSRLSTSEAKIGMMLELVPAEVLDYKTVQ